MAQTLLEVTVQFSPANYSAEKVPRLHLSTVLCQ